MLFCFKKIREGDKSISVNVVTCEKRTVSVFPLIIPAKNYFTRIVLHVKNVFLANVMSLKENFSSLWSVKRKREKTKSSWVFIKTQHYAFKAASIGIKVSLPKRRYNH